MADTTGKTIQCKAAVAKKPNKPITIETVDVAPPKKGEIRIKILYTGVCHSDLAVLNTTVPGRFPVILGHEGAGIVESVGEGVTEFKAGDHVVPLYLPQCKTCPLCTSGKTNLCQIFLGDTSLLVDGTSRFSCNGEAVHYFMQCSTFSQYTVVPEFSAVKVDKDAPLDKVCLLGCGVATGYGSALNTAKVEAGSTCAIWGLGPIGLSAVMGCKKAGAKKIIGIDLNPDKFEQGKKFGLTDGLNPKDYEKPIPEVIKEMTGGAGVDYAFECIGNINAMKAAYNSTRLAWGKTIILGLAPMKDELPISPYPLIYGKTVTGSVYGGMRGKEDLPKLIKSYNDKDLLLDEFVTHRMGLEKVNEAFDLMKESKCLRTVLNLWPEENTKSEL